MQNTSRLRRRPAIQLVPGILARGNGSRSGAGSGSGLPDGFIDWPFDKQDEWLEEWLRDVWNERKRRMSNFRKAIDIIIATHEGGFQNRADDPGNWTADGQLKGTKFGISAHSFPDEDIEGLTLNRAEELYRENWGHFAAIDDQQVMTKVLDLAVNMQWGDKGHATKILQHAIYGRGIPVTVDGVFGTKTATACNNLKAGELLPEICTQAAFYYKALEATSPSMAAWFKNWDKRAAWIPPTEEAASV
jgi:lysozyme family protein